MSPLEVSNWELLADLAFAFALMGVYGYATFRLDRHIRLKGYHSPFRAILMATAYIAVMGLGFFVDGLSPASCYACSPAANPEYFQPGQLRDHVWRFILNYGASTTLGMAVIAGVALAIPRGARRAGPRQVRVPWQAVAWFFLFLIPLSWAAVWAWNLGWSNAFRLSILLCAAYAGSSYLAARMRAKGMKQVLTEDARPPVLYLRAFDNENEIFATLTHDECVQLGVPMLNPSAWRHPATLEAYLALTLKARIGPFIALGDPNDYLPPGGAEREYFADNTWQQVFRALSQRSAFMLMKPERSGNLLLELRLLRDGGQLGNLFIVTKPAPSLWSFLRGWWVRRETRDWDRFAAELRTIGIEVGAYPGSGTVLGFDRARTAVMIATNLATPAGYVSTFEQGCLAQVGQTPAGIQPPTSRAAECLSPSATGPVACRADR